MTDGVKELTLAELPADRTEGRQFYRDAALKTNAGDLQVRIGNAVRLTEGGAFVEAWIFVEKPT